MSLQSLSRPLRRPLHGVTQATSADPQTFTAVALLLAVLIANALLILTAAPSFADLASFYGTTT